MRFPLGFGLLLVACSSKYEPPAPPAPREATAVSASAGHTWDAVIEQFAARNIPIRTIERVSGLIVTDELSVGGEGASWADCGRSAASQGQRPNAASPPTHATYNALVRGDSSTSTVKVTVRWSLYLSPAGNIECFTTNEWEQAFEGEVKGRAERYWMQERSRSPAASSARSVPARPAPRSAQPPPERATESESPDSELPRGNAELLRQPEFGVAVVDCTRLGLMSSYGEISLGVLVVNLTDGAMTGGSLGFNLANLYDGYRRTVPGDRSGVIELRHGGTKVGEYNSNGLVRSNWR